MLDNKPELKSQLEQLIANHQAGLNNIKNIALSQAWKILQIIVAEMVQVLESIGTDLAGKDKKSIALAYISKFYDIAFIMIDIPFVPSAIESIIHKYIKSILMIMVSSSVDAMVQIFRETGIFLKKEVKANEQ